MVTPKSGKRYTFVHGEVIYKLCGTYLDYYLMWHNRQPENQNPTAKIAFKPKKGGDHVKILLTEVDLNTVVEV